MAWDGNALHARCRGVLGESMPRRVVRTSVSLVASCVCDFIGRADTITVFHVYIRPLIAPRQAVECISALFRDC